MDWLRRLVTGKTQEQIEEDKARKQRARDRRRRSREQRAREANPMLKWTKGRPFMGVPGQTWKP
jgi:hypothetical protein